MGQISPAGYADLRDLMALEWAFIAIRSGDQERFRLPTNDPRVTVEPEEGRLVYRVVLTGSDPEINASETNKVPVDGSALFADETAGEERASEKFGAVEFQHPQDKLTITQNINVPGGGGMLQGIKSIGANRELDASDWGQLIRFDGNADAVQLKVTGAVIAAAPVGAMFAVAVGGAEPKGYLRIVRDVGDAWLRVHSPTGYLGNINARVTEGAHVHFYKLSDDHEEGRVLYGLASAGVSRA